MVERSCYFRWSELIIRVMSPGLSQELTPQTKPGTTAPPTPLEVPIPTYESLTPDVSPQGQADQSFKL